MSPEDVSLSTLRLGHAIQALGFGGLGRLGFGGFRGFPEGVGGFKG